MRSGLAAHPVEDIAHKLTMFRHAVTSLAQTEPTVPQAREPEALPVAVR